MSRVEFIIRGDPSDSDDESEMLLFTAAIDFFAEMLCCSTSQVLTFNIDHCSILTRALLGAANQVCSSAQLSCSDMDSHKRQKVHQVLRSIEQLILSLYADAFEDIHMEWDIMGETKEFYAEEVTGKLLGHFSACEKLKFVLVGLPRQMWANNLNAVKNLLTEKPPVSHLNFGYHSDNDGHVLALMRDCVLGEESKTCKISDFQVEALNEVNGDGFFRFCQDVKNAGGSLSIFDVRDSDGTKGKVEEGVDADDIPMKVYIKHLRIQC
jgi:hypothetical protein